MKRLGHKTITAIVFTVHTLLIIGLCAVIIHFGKREIDQAQRHADLEKAFMDNLFECSMRLNVFERALRNLPEPWTLENVLMVEYKARILLGGVEEALHRDKARTGVAESARLTALAEHTRTLCSVSAAMGTDLRLPPTESRRTREDADALADLSLSIGADLHALFLTELDKTSIWRSHSLFFFKRLQYFVIMLFVLTAIFSFGASSLFAYILNRSLRRLSEGTKAISSGNLSYSFNDIPGDEIGQVMKDFNLMTERLAAQNDQLVGANKELGEKARLLLEAHQHKDRFLANMSHELRTPLSAIIGFSELILRHKTADEKTRHQSERILRAAEHLLELISDLLQIAKIDAGTVTPHFERVDMSACVGEVAGMLRPIAEKKGLSLTCSCPPGLFLMADKRMLKQIIINLAGNAVKFTEKGEVRLAAACQTSALSDTSDQADHTQGATNALLFSVSDTGIGISEADQKLIFKDFLRLQSSHTSNYEGAGLGLTLSKRLVELHGATITLESAPGRGSVFTVRFPHVDTEPQSNERNTKL